MNSREYYKAKKEFPLQKIILKKLSQSSPDHRKELLKFVELLITVKGHAWCMDVKNERKKMAKLLVDAIGELR